jgi:hypothetical protein
MDKEVRGATCSPIETCEETAKPVAYLIPIKILNEEDDPVPADDNPVLYLIVRPLDDSDPMPDPVADLEFNFPPSES